MSGAGVPGRALTPPKIEKLRSRPGPKQGKSFLMPSHKSARRFATGLAQSAAKALP